MVEREKIVMMLLLFSQDFSFRPAISDSDGDGDDLVMTALF